MDTILNAPENVKWILATLDPHTGNCATYFATDHGLINIPIEAGTIDIFSLLYRSGEIDHPDAVLHESGFVCCFLDHSTVQIPLKDLPGFPLHRSQPADFQMAITDFPRLVQFRDIGATDILITFWRPTQRDEVTKRHISHLNRLLTVRQQGRNGLRDVWPDLFPPKSPARHLHVVPPRKAEPKPPSTRLDLALRKIPTQMLPLPESYGHPFSDCCLYLLLRSFPVGNRGPEYNLYCDMGIEQLSLYMHYLKAILKKHPDPEIRAKARRMGTSCETVKRALARLLKSGLAIPIVIGKPDYYCTKRLISRNGKERDKNSPLAKRVQENPRKPLAALKSMGESQGPGTDPESRDTP